jgi:hypothetical protein
MTGVRVSLPLVVSVIDACCIAAVPDQMCACP